MYEGFIRLRANEWNISESNAVKNERCRLVEDSNPVQLFVNVCFDKCTKGKVRRPEIYELFNAWAQFNNINIGKYITRQRFYRKFEAILESMGISSCTKKIRGDIYYIGIEKKKDCNL